MVEFYVKIGNHGKLLYKRMAQPIGWAINVISATEAAADPAKNLPNGAATGVAALVAREDKHLLSSFSSNR